MTHSYLEEIEDIREEIKNLALKEADRKRRAHAVLSRQINARNTRRKILAGEAILKIAAVNPVADSHLRELLAETLTTPSDRALFDL